MRHTSRPLPRLKTLACTALLALLAACSTVDRGKPPALESAATWAVLPFANHTETPLAGNRAEAIAAALLQGLRNSGVRQGFEAGDGQHSSALWHRNRWPLRRTFAVAQQLLRHIV